MSQHLLWKRVTFSVLTKLKTETEREILSSPYFFKHYEKKFKVTESVYAFMNFSFSYSHCSNDYEIIIKLVRR